MAVSRSSRAFLQHHGLESHDDFPRSRLAPEQLRIATRAPGARPAQQELLVYEGEVAPDRGEARPWPYEESS